MINDQLDPKIWPSKAQRSVKDFSSKTHCRDLDLVRQIQSKSWKHLSKSSQFMQLHPCIDATAFWMILTLSSTVLWNPLPTWSLPDAHQSWQAASISRFRTAAALSSSRRCAWWQTVHDTFFQPCGNAISRQSLGKFLVMVRLWWLLGQFIYHPKLLFHWFIAFLSQASLP